MVNSSSDISFSHLPSAQNWSFRIFRKQKCKELIEELSRSKNENRVIMVRAPAGSGKTQLAFDLYRICYDSKDPKVTCIYVNAKQFLTFEKLSIALERYLENKDIQDTDRVVVLVDELQEHFVVDV